MRTLREGDSKILTSTDTPSNLEFFDLERPLRELSTQLRIVRQFSSKKYVN